MPKCTWQTLPDLGSDHLPISITIPTSPLINSFHRPSSFNYNKARWDEYLTYIDTHCPTPTLQHFLSLKPPTLLPNSSMMLPLLPFLSAASTALLKPGGLRSRRCRRKTPKGICKGTLFRRRPPALYRHFQIYLHCDF